ncbi:MAG: tRNA pseudouridine(54/55) synthase Pus10 [Nitrosopumilus sp.]|nr:tRNA pseudouridine(54/55) synthase Pus10 [Nitrosopumilus sp.]
MGRLFSKKLRRSSNKLLGKEMNKNQNFAKKCFICKNLFENLDYFLKLMLNSSSNYSYDTFSIGVILKPSFIDRDDFIRSQYKLRGTDGIKTGITREMTKLFSKKTKKILDTQKPDVTFTVNLKDDSVQLRSKSITFAGRYVKTIRGIDQKQKPCVNCSGKGCRMCDFHGISEFESIEGQISKLLFEKIGGTTAKFTWIGGEDKSSLVLGTGRPFFVKLQNPLKRNLKLTSFKSNSLKISNFKLVSESPKQPLKFHSLIQLKISTSSDINSKNLTKLKILEKHPVVVYRKSGERSEKKIFFIKYKKNSKNIFTLSLKTEGGLPIMKFIDGNDVIPGISQILDTTCKCHEFDFKDIEIQ